MTNPLEELLKQIDEGGDPNETEIVLPTEALEASEEMEELPLLNENDLVDVTGNANTEGTEKLTLRGRIRGIAPIHSPFGIVGMDYIIELEDPSLLPMPTEMAYAYTCITAPREMIEVVNEGGNSMDSTETI